MSDFIQLSANVETQVNKIKSDYEGMTSINDDRYAGLRGYSYFNVMEAIEVGATLP
jgi:hypothetical protein